MRRGARERLRAGGPATWPGNGPPAGNPMCNPSIFKGGSFKQPFKTEGLHIGLRLPFRPTHAFQNATPATQITTPAAQNGTPATQNATPATEYNTCHRQCYACSARRHAGHNYNPGRRVRGGSCGFGWQQRWWWRWVAVVQMQWFRRGDGGGSGGRWLWRWWRCGGADIGRGPPPLNADVIPRHRGKWRPPNARMNVMDFRRVCVRSLDTPPPKNANLPPD